MSSDAIECIPLGQGGFRLGFGAVTVYIDPYLSDAVEKADGPDFRRLVPIWKLPGLVRDADWVLITHSHMDHCDLDTLLPISRSSHRCRFVGPKDVRAILAARGIAATRLVPAVHQWLDLGEDLRVHPVVAAHPDLRFDEDGASHCVGYVIEYRERRIYHAGDTLLNESVLRAVRALMPIEVAILPVNERNYYRDSRGIIGNMSVREAFQFAADIEAATLVPVHWDMFALNAVHREELETFHRLERPPYSLSLNPVRL